MSKPRIKYQDIQFEVTASGQEIPIEAETDKLYKRCTGIHVSVTDAGAIFSSFSLKINDREVFPDEHEVYMVNTGREVPLDEKYYTIEEPAGASKIKGRYKDFGTAAFPYRVTISIRQED